MGTTPTLNLNTYVGPVIIALVNQGAKRCLPASRCSSMVEFSSGTTRVVCVPMGHSMYPPIRVLYIDFHLTHPEGFATRAMK